MATTASSILNPLSGLALGLAIGAVFTNDSQTERLDKLTHRIEQLEKSVMPKPLAEKPEQTAGEK